MARARRSSVRLWQTELFVVVIVVAILILSVSLSQGLQITLADLSEADQLSHTSALAAQISSEFPLTVESLGRIREAVDEFREIYGDDVWVYDIDGTVIDTENSGGPPEAVLEEARIQGLSDSPAYSQMNLEADGFVTSGKAVYDAEGRRAAVVVTAGSVRDSLNVLDAVRERLWATFWVALIVAGLLGFGFAEFIGRRVRQMSKAAVAIADGDFDQRLPTGPVPDEIHELAESYNRMAVTLGEAFSTLREREQEIATVVESLGEGVIAFDAEGCVRVINPEAIELLGLAKVPADIESLHAKDLTNDTVITSMIEQSLVGSDVQDTTTLGDHTVMLHGSPIQSQEGGTEGAVLLMSDITDRIRLEEAQQRFVANASHEMRTPIAALKGLLELLTGGAKEDPETRDDFLRTMSLEVDRLGRLVADLLTLAQLEAGSLKLKEEEVVVGEVLREVTTIMQPLAKRSGVDLVIDAQDGLLAECDRDRIVQVLLGFVDNALKHSPEGRTVTLRAAAEYEKVVLEVKNEGEGIDPDVIPRLFDRFYRVDESRTSPRGTGLGLSIASEIIEAHRSRVEVDSAPGEGAIFRFRLPLAP